MIAYILKIHISQLYNLMTSIMIIQLIMMDIPLILKYITGIPKVHLNLLLVA